MAEYTVTIELNSHKRGNLWIGILELGPVTINGEQPEAPLKRVCMAFAHASGSSILLDSDEGADGVIDILDPELWKATIPKQGGLFPLAGGWKFDIQFFEEGQEYPLTLYKGVLDVVDGVLK